MSDAEKLKLARKAIYKVLSRIRDEKKIAYLIGYGTQSFEDLCVAAAAIEDKSPRAIGARTLECEESEMSLLPETVEEASQS